MTNEEIRIEINNLKDQFLKNNFTYNQQNIEIGKKIFALQNICTHKDANNNFARCDDFCLYCGRKFNYHGD